MPLQVLVRDVGSSEPRDGVKVDFEVVEGQATVTPAATTDSRGIASATVRVGPAQGSATIRAKSAGLQGNPALFTVNAVAAPVISSVTPAIATSGATVQITGTNFGSTVAAVSVLFDGVRGSVTAVTPTSITAVVPACAPTGSTDVVVAIGSNVTSNPVAITTQAGNVAPLRMQRGEVRVLSNATEFECIRLPGDLPGSSYLVIAQNVAATHALDMAYELTAFGVPAPVALLAASDRTTFADAWELALRQRERTLPAPSKQQPAVRAPATIPQVGDRRTFNTLTASGSSVQITAEVKAVTERAILYQDIDAASVFTPADYQGFGALFDDVIYDTDVAVFGPIGDIDANGRIIMVFTPKVNALTARGTGSYIAGYFYACDLLAKKECTASNGGEIFYSMVPDPTGQFSDPKSATLVLRSVPPVLAHEFQHMISFGQRSGTLDAIWLGEGLAHSAEDIVGEALIAQGDISLGNEFRAQNFSKARQFLGDPDGFSMISDESPGTIEMRGAAWLLLRYLRGHYGGNELLKDLTSTTLTGTASIAAHTGRTWADLVSEFAVALYAHNAPDLAGVQIESHYTFTNFDPRAALSTSQYPLALRFFGFSDFALAGSLPSSSLQYAYVQAPQTASGNSLNLSFSGKRGAAFIATASPRLTIMRLR